MPASYDMRAEGLGTLAVLPDRILVKIFTCLLKTDAKLLLPLSPVSKAFYAFVEEETLWKDLVIRRCAGDFTFKGSWKLTHFLPRNVFPPEPLKRIDVHDLNSDYLQRKWKISNAPIGDYEALPELSPGEASFFRVDRRANLSLEEFEREYAAKNRPVIITDAIQHWPAWTSWTEKNLLKKLEGVSCRMDEVGPDGTKIHMTFSDYLQYAHNYHDDDPIYYFDPNFADKTPSLLDDYEIPEYFADDAFSLLDLDDRPYFRWIVIGPKRSGSPFHVDPFFTSAWNALFKGTKRWALYPPESIPPGVKGYWGKRGNWKTINPPDPMEWYLFTYPAIQDTPLRPIECIQHPGDLIFIPSGWWHLVLNIEDTQIAVTQNFCNRFNFKNVYRDMHSDQGLLTLFTETLLMERPDLMQMVNIPDFYYERLRKKRKKEEKKRIKQLLKQQGANGNGHQPKLPCLDLSNVSRDK